MPNCFLYPFLCFLSLTSFSLASDASDVCETYKNNKDVTKAVAFLDQSCYFIVRNATRKTNYVRNWLPSDPHDYIPSTGVYYIFDVSEARSICSKHNGMLPIIKSKAEDRFIWDAFNNGSDFDVDMDACNPIQKITIGLNVTGKVGTKGLKWDDNSDLSYLPEKWANPKQNWNGSFAYTMKVDETIYWAVAPEHVLMPSALGVLCEWEQSRGSNHIKAPTSASHKTKRPGKLSVAITILLASILFI